MKRIPVLFLAFFAAYMASAAPVNISDMIPTNSPSGQSLLELSAVTGVGYTTRSITISNLVRIGLSNLPIAFSLQTNAVNVGTANFLNLLPGDGITFRGTNTTTTNSLKILAEITSAGIASSNYVTLVLLNMVSNVLATGSSSAVGFTNASILYVQTNGYALGTAIRGNPDRPYNTLTAAVSQAQSGDTIRVGAGTHYVISSRVALPDNVNLIGEGMHSTKIVGNSQLIADGIGPLVNPGDNSYVGHLSISSTNEANFAAPIGVTSVSLHAFTNVVVEGVELFGNTDNVYIDHTDLVEMKLVGCVFIGTFDNVFIDGNTNSLVHLIACDIYGTNLVDLANNGQNVRNINVFNGRVKLDNCVLRASGGTQWSANIYTADADARVWVNNTSFETVAAGIFIKRITNAAGNIWVQSSSLGPGDVVGPGTTTYDGGTYHPAVTNALRANILGPYRPIGPAGLTNIDVSFPKYYHTLTGPETMSLGSLTNSYAKVEIQVYGSNDVSFPATWIKDSGGSSPVSVTSNTLFVIRMVTNHIHIDWTGTNSGGGSGTLSVIAGVATNLTVHSSNLVNVPLIAQPRTGTITNSFQVNDTNAEPAFAIDSNNVTVARSALLTSNLVQTLYTLPLTSSSGNATNGILDFNHTRWVLRANEHTNVVRLIYGTNQQAGREINANLTIWTGPTNLHFYLPSDWYRANTNRPILLSSNSAYVAQISSLGLGATNITLTIDPAKLTTEGSTVVADLLLDLAPTAAWAAYSYTRKLGPLHTNAYRLQPLGDFGTFLDVPFNASGRVDTNAVNAYMAAVAVTNATFFGIGVSTIVYDGTGNGHHLTYDTIADTHPVVIELTNKYFVMPSKGMPQLAAYFSSAHLGILTNLTASLNQPITVYWVAGITNTTDNLNLPLFDGAVAGRTQFGGGGNPGELIMNAGSTLGPLAFTASVPLLITCKFNGASSSFRKNDGSHLTGNAGSDDPDGFTLGGDPGFVQGLESFVSEVIIYSAAHTDNGTDQTLVSDNINAFYILW